MGSLPPKVSSDRGRGARVIARARVFLDHAFPITGTSHADVRRYHVQDGQLLMDDLPLISLRNLSATRSSTGGGSQK